MNRLVILGLALLCSLASCGRGTESKYPTVEKIQHRGTVLVGTTGDYRPLSYKEPETGEYWGFDLDVAGKFTCQPARSSSMTRTKRFLHKWPLRSLINHSQMARLAFLCEKGRKTFWK